MKFAISELMRMGVIEKPEECSIPSSRTRQEGVPAYFDTYDRIDEVIDY